MSVKIFERKCGIPIVIEFTVYIIYFNNLKNILAKNSKNYNKITK